MKFPMIAHGLEFFVRNLAAKKGAVTTYISYISRLIVKEKQQLMYLLDALGSGFLNWQVVSIAFWLVSKAIVPNLSQ